MEVLAQGGDEMGVVEASIESTVRRLHPLRRRRNSLGSPLLRLPMELILGIFARMVQPGDDDDGPQCDWS